MLVQISPSELITRLTEASRFTGNKTAAPLLSGVYLQAQEEKLTLRTSTGSVIYESTLPCQVTTPGECVVPADLTLSILRSLGTGEVELKLESEILFLTQGKSQTEIATLPAEGFPTLKTEGKDQSFLLPVAEFVATGKKVLVAASSDETKPVLTALALESATPNALVATDGFRLFRIQVELSLDEPGLFLLPSRVIKDLFNILEKSGETTVQCQTDTNRQEILFHFGATTLQISAIQGEFPPYRNIIPESCAFAFTVDREELIQKVNQAMIFAREFSSIVVFTVDNQELVIRSQANVKGKTESRLPCANIQGQPVQFACNGRFVLDFLNVIDSQEITIQGNESLKPVLLTIPDQPSYLYLIMPFKLAE